MQCWNTRKVFETVADAVADCAHVYATTVRKRGVTKPVLTPEAAAHEIVGHDGAQRDPVRARALGARNRGRRPRPRDPHRADQSEFASLNLAQAVILVAYEWSKHRDLAMPPREELLAAAPQEELEGLIGHFEELLGPRDYFFPESRAEATRLTLRTLLTKPGWNHLEVRTLRGVLSALARAPGGKRP